MSLAPTNDDTGGAPHFLASPRDIVHSAQPGSPYRYANRQLQAMVGDFLAQAHLEDGDTILDYGCADSQYRHLIPAGANYLGADLPGNAMAQVQIRPDGGVPLADCSVTTVLSTQVLEHVATPAEYLAECHRVLQPGGTLILSTHGLMYYHPDPEDYWRWTTAGLTRLLREQGFDVIEVRGLLGLAAAALQLFQDATLRKVPPRLRSLYCRAMQTSVGWIDSRYSSEARARDCWTISVRAVKR